MGDCNGSKVKVTLYTNVQGKVNTYAKMKNKYCKKGVVPCKNMQKMDWPNILKHPSINVPKNSCSSTTFMQVCRLQPRALLEKTPSQIFSCKFFEISDDSHPSAGQQLPVKLTRQLRGNTSLIWIAICCIMRHNLWRPSLPINLS